MKRFIILVLVCFAFSFFADGIIANEGEPGDIKNPQKNAVYHPTLNVWVPADMDQTPPALSSKKSKNKFSSNSSRAISVVHSFGFPSGWSYARDAAWDGSHLWIGENLNSRIYRIDPVTGSVISSFYGPDSNPWGLAWNGTNLHSATITMYHYPPGDTLPDWVHCVTTTGTKLYKWLAPDSPDATPHGAAYDLITGRLWLSDGYYGMIYELDPSNGNIFSSYSFPGSEPLGLTWDGNYLYAIDGPNLTLLKLDKAGNVIDSVSIASLGSDPEGLTWDGQYFWITENQTNTIYQIDAGMNALTTDVTQISETTGGVANLTLNADPGNAYRNYIIAGSVSGTSPGILLPGGLAKLPLNWDIFTNIVIDLINTAPFTNFMGTLDGNGAGTAVFDTLGPIPGASGITLYFAFALNSPWNFASNYVAIDIVP